MMVCLINELTPNALPGLNRARQPELIRPLITTANSRTSDLMSVSPFSSFLWTIRCIKAIVRPKSKKNPERSRPILSTGLIEVKDWWFFVIPISNSIKKNVTKPPNIIKCLIHIIWDRFFILLWTTISFKASLKKGKTRFVLFWSWTDSWARSIWITFVKRFL